MSVRLVALVVALTAAGAEKPASGTSAVADAGDPPARVARLNYVSGSVSFQPAGTEEWVSATLNRPLTAGDSLWTENSAKAELHIGSTAMRLGSETSFAFLDLNDRAVQVKLTEGLMNSRLRQLDEFETFEVDTRAVLGLTETNDEIRLDTVVPGFSARTLAVDVLPNSITIEGQVRYTEHPGEEKIHFSEFGEKLLLRQFDLPSRIGPNEVTATLEDGVLGIAAKKAAVTIAPMTAEVKTRRTAA